MESGRFAAEMLQRASLTDSRLALDASMAGYADQIRNQWGKHFTLGRGFAGLIGRPAVMKLALRTGMPVPLIMRFVVRLMANLTDRVDQDAMDRTAHLLERLVPATSNGRVRVNP